MAINRFSNPVPAKYVPLPLDQLLHAGMLKDKRLDDEIDNINQTLDKFAGVEAIVPGDKLYLEQKKKEVVNTINEAAKTDLNNPINHRKVQEALSGFANDPNILHNIIPRTTYIKDALKQKQDLIKSKQFSHTFWQDFQDDLDPIWNDPDSYKNSDFTNPYTVKPDSGIQKSLGELVGKMKDGILYNAKGEPIISYDRNNGFITKWKGVTADRYLEGMASYLDDNQLDELSSAWRQAMNRKNNPFVGEFEDYVNSRLAPLANSLAHIDPTMMNWNKAISDANRTADKLKEDVNPLPRTYTGPTQEDTQASEEQYEIKDGKVGKSTTAKTVNTRIGNVPLMNPEASDFLEPNVEQKSGFQVNQELTDQANKWLKENKIPDDIKKGNKDIQLKYALAAIDQIKQNSTRNYKAYNTVVPGNFKTAEYQNELVMEFAKGSTAIQLDGGKTLDKNKLVTELGFSSLDEFMKINAKNMSQGSIALFGTTIPGGSNVLLYDSKGRGHIGIMQPFNEFGNYMNSVAGVFSEIDLADPNPQVKFDRRNGIAVVADNNSNINGWSKEATIYPTVPDLDEYINYSRPHLPPSMKNKSNEDIKKYLESNDYVTSTSEGVVVYKDFNGNNLSQSPNNYLYKKFNDALKYDVERGGIRNYMYDFIEREDSKPENYNGNTYYFDDNNSQPEEE